jgi:hypothetical protein
MARQAPPRARAALDAGAPALAERATINSYFDSWADALRAAGLPVRYAHEFDLPLAERVGAALRMDAAGHSVTVIAYELGVYKYLPASAC